jgi:hypothetical protein
VEREEDKEGGGQEYMAEEPGARKKVRASKRKKGRAKRARVTMRPYLTKKLPSLMLVKRD